MTTIPYEELRNNVADVLRRAEAGEQFTITVAGRPVAELGPAQPRRWVTGADLARAWKTASPAGLTPDLSRFPAGLSDPFGAH